MVMVLLLIVAPRKIDAIKSSLALLVIIFWLVVEVVVIVRFSCCCCCEFIGSGVASLVVVTVLFSICWYRRALELLAAVTV